MFPIFGLESKPTDTSVCPFGIIYIPDSGLSRFTVGVSECTQWQFKYQRCGRTFRVQKNHTIWTPCSSTPFSPRNTCQNYLILLWKMRKNLSAAVEFSVFTSHHDIECFWLKSFPIHQHYFFFHYYSIWHKHAAAAPPSSFINGRGRQDLKH